MSGNKEDLGDVIRRKQSIDIEDRDIDSDGLEKQLITARIDRYNGDTTDRKWLASWSTWVVSIWMICVIFILCFNNKLLCLSDNVIISLLVTTTLNVLGLSYIVLKGHFNANESSP